MADIRQQKLADLIVNYSIKVQPGELVFITGEPVSLPLIIEMAKAVIQAGGMAEPLVDIPEVGESVLRYGSREQLLAPSVLTQAIAEKADAYIYIWGKQNLKDRGMMEPERLSIRRTARREAHQLMDKREETGDFRWCGTQFPTQADAQEAGMSLWDYEDFVYGAGHIDDDDPAAFWAQMSAEHQQWVRYLNEKKEIHFRAPNTDIRVNVAGRKWISCAGEANFPDGEIFTCPVENSMQGHIAFSYPAIYGGQEVENVRLTVADGKIVKAQADKGEEYLNAMLDTDAGGRYFGEIAIGTNYGIQRFTKNMLFDEKIGGTIHMAAGASVPGAGGKNESSIHWDMLCDMADGEIMADGEVFYRQGRFLEGVL